MLEGHKRYLTRWLSLVSGSFSSWLLQELARQKLHDNNDKLSHSPPASGSVCRTHALCSHCQHAEPVTIRSARSRHVCAHLQLLLATQSHGAAHTQHKHFGQQDFKFISLPPPAPVVLSAPVAMMSFLRCRHDQRHTTLLVTLHAETVRIVRFQSHLNHMVPRGSAVRSNNTLVTFTPGFKKMLRGQAERFRF